jgi:AAHS family 4-hydroxybenzoate transporter-like MFS transporter
MFWIGGLAPLLIAVCLLLALPESVKYLAARPLRRAELLATIRRLRRDLSIANDAQFVIAPGAQASGSGLAQIFGRGLAWITPIRWICFATALMANFFINSWLPLIFESNGFTSKQSGIAISCYHYGVRSAGCS